MSTLVTGGTGFFGEQVVRTLVDSGRGPVRVLARGTYEAAALEGAEVLRGDVLADPEGGTPLWKALAGVEQVFHLAGCVSRDPAAGQTMMRVHVDGTRRLLETAKATGVRRVVVASSSGTIAVSRAPTPIPNEEAPYATELVAQWPYYMSKICQEKLALDLGRTLGLEVVLVNPSLLLGPGDRRQSSTGDVIRFLRRQIPAVPSGGLSFVDVRDAARATVAAMERGRVGQRYLLGGPNWTIAEFFGRLERASKVRAPWLRVPPRAARLGAAVVEELYRKLEREPPVGRASVEMGELFWYCDASKATRELAFAARDPGETLDETVRYARRQFRV